MTAPIDRSDAPAFPARLQILFAVACGVMVANTYYAQPLIALIAPDLHLSEHAAGVIVTTTQLGYAAALLLVTPLADLVENRTLVLVLVAVTIVALIGVAVAERPFLVLLCSFVAGAGSTGAQVLVPLSAHLTPPEKRGRVIGNIMAGLLGGIMLARPLSSFIAAHFGWRAVFWVSVVMMMGIGLLLARALPSRKPPGGVRYGAMIASIGRLFVIHPTLRRRTAYQALIFATFQLFWTAAPLALAQRFGLTQSGIALFALAGAGGALCAPVMGRLADRGFTRPATGLTIAGVIAAFALSGWAVAALNMAAFVLAALLLDSAAQSNQILSQRVIYGLDAAARGRINAAYMTLVFTGGAAGSFLGALTFATGGWALVAATGATFGVVVLGLYVTEFRKQPAPQVGTEPIQHAAPPG